MNTKKLFNKWSIVFLLILTVAFYDSFPANAATYYLRAEEFTQTMADGVIIPMWGYALDSDFEAHDGVLSVPGPRLTVPENDSVLIIRLENNLSHPTSIVIPGQFTALLPVRESNGRVSSFTQTTVPNNTSYTEYRWDNLKPGSYLYQSGTHPAVQVQMGLYGALTKDAGPMQVYPDVHYGHEFVLVFSEIDPLLHEAVANKTYGIDSPTVTMTSTVDYNPKYFLINGKSFPKTISTGLDPVPANKIILFRYLNAGLKTRVPYFYSSHVLQVAEDGNQLPFSRELLAIPLAAGKTVDAIVGPLPPGQYPIFDRRLALTNSDQPYGGMLTRFSVLSGQSSFPPLQIKKGDGRNTVLRNNYR